MPTQFMLQLHVASKASQQKSLLTLEDKDVPLQFDSSARKTFLYAEQFVSALI